MFDMQDARIEFNIDGAKVWDLTRNPTPKAVQKTVGFNPTHKTVQKNVGFNLTSIGVGFNPTPNKLADNQIADNINADCRHDDDGWDLPNT